MHRYSNLREEISFDYVFRGTDIWSEIDIVQIRRTSSELKMKERCRAEQDMTYRFCSIQDLRKPLYSFKHNIYDIIII